MQGELLCAVSPTEFRFIKKHANEQGRETTIYTCPEKYDRIKVIYPYENGRGCEAAVVIRLLARDPESGRYPYTQEECYAADNTLFSGEIDLALWVLISQSDYQFYTNDGNI